MCDIIIPSQVCVYIWVWGLCVYVCTCDYGLITHRPHVISRVAQSKKGHLVQTNLKFSFFFRSKCM